ncbi:MAG: GNAT family N-acetyltransferase [Vicinamibacterales bacterium]
MHIELDDLSRPAVVDLLREHLANMHELSPPEKVFAFDVSRLRAPDVTFWTAWDGVTLVGCGALKELSAAHGEIKSMRTPRAHRRLGAGRAILQHIIDTAVSRGYETLSLETGSHPDFAPAHALYRSAGFTRCGPFGAYRDDPNSVFMTLHLPDASRDGRGEPR